MKYELIARLNNKCRRNRQYAEFLDYVKQNISITFRMRRKRTRLQAHSYSNQLQFLLFSTSAVTKGREVTSFTYCVILIYFTNYLSLHRPQGLRSLEINISPSNIPIRWQK